MTNDANQLNGTGYRVDPIQLFMAAAMGLEATHRTFQLMAKKLRFHSFGRRDQVESLQDVGQAPGDDRCTVSGVPCQGKK